MQMGQNSGSAKRVGRSKKTGGAVCNGRARELGTWCQRSRLSHVGATNPSVLALCFRIRLSGVEKAMLALKSLVSFLKAEDGPTGVEYAVMLALIVWGGIDASATLGQNANSTFSFVGSAIKPK